MQRRRRKGQEGEGRRSGEELDPLPPFVTAGNEDDAAIIFIPEGSAQHCYTSTPHKHTLHRHPFAIATYGEPQHLSPFSIVVFIRHHITVSVPGTSKRRP
jgi:hypothetical protein